MVDDPRVAPALISFTSVDALLPMLAQPVARAVVAALPAGAALAVTLPRVGGASAATLRYECGSTGTPYGRLANERPDCRE